VCGVLGAECTPLAGAQNCGSGRRVGVLRWLVLATSLALWARKHCIHLGVRRRCLCGGGKVGRETDVGDDRMRDGEVNVALLKLLEVLGVRGSRAISIVESPELLTAQGGWRRFYYCYRCCSWKGCCCRWGCWCCEKLCCFSQELLGVIRHLTASTLISPLLLPLLRCVRTTIVPNVTRSKAHSANVSCSQLPGDLLIAIVVFLNLAENSLDKGLRILFFSFRALCLITTCQVTEDSQYI